MTALLALAANVVRAQTSTFTYQGRLADGGTPANGTYDLQFKVFDTLAGGIQQPQPTPVTITFAGAQGVPVTNGLFTLQLDFGAAVFPGADRFLDVAVKHPADPSYTPLLPRQQLTSTPYAVAATSAPASTLTGTTLASGVTGSSLNSLGTVTSGTWKSSAIAVVYGGTGSETAGDARANLGAAATSGSLSQFASTTSAELAGVISDATGSGALVLATSPLLSNLSISGDITGTGALTVATTGNNALTLNTGALTAPVIVQVGGTEHARVTNTAVTQAVGDSGLVKAAAHVAGGLSPLVSRQFNNLPGNAAIIVSRISTGIYQVDFGTDVSARFYQATIGTASFGSGVGQVTVSPQSGNSNALLVGVTDSAGNPATGLSFFLVVY